MISTKENVERENVTEGNHINQKRKNIKNSGITLIALVVTIIVLLILAGISISMLSGRNGILTRAKGAKVENRAGNVYDQIQVWRNNRKTDELADEYADDTAGNSTSKTVLDLLGEYKW